jgi:hypothetical protein
LAARRGKAARSRQDRFHLRASGHANDDDVAFAREIVQIPRLLGARLDQTVDRLAVAVRDHRQREPLGDDVFRHAAPHEAQADKADAFHAHESSRLMGSDDKAICRRRHCRGGMVAQSSDPA